MTPVSSPSPSPTPGPVGFLGAGTMGAGMIASLLRAGFPVHAFDLDPARLAAAAEQGAVAGASAAAVAAACPVVCCSLPSSAALERAAAETLLPAARPGFTVLDFGTTAIPETRRLAAAFADRGASFLDTPVSGSPRHPGYRIFTGGDAAAAERCRPLFLALTEEPYWTYCGPSGAGQAMKAVNQLGMGLGSAAWMEAVGFGVHCGLDPATIARAVGGEGGFRLAVRQMAGRVQAGTAEQDDAKLAELAYFLRHAAEAGFPLPLTRALHEFCAPHEKRWRDNMGRPYASFWHHLVTPAPRSPDPAP